MEIEESYYYYYLLELLCNVRSTNLKFETLRHKTKNYPILQESS